MRFKDRLSAAVARQLGHPGGLAGRLMAVMLDRSNARSIAAAVDALAPAPGAAAADIGFGGGLGLALLLERVGPAGRVHGIDVSSTVLARAGRRFGAEIATGRLVLHDASLTDLRLPPGSLDGAITVNTIYFVADLERACAELAAVLKPSGRAVIGLGDPDWMRTLPTTPHGFRLRSLPELRERAGASGRAVEDHLRVAGEKADFHLLVVRPPAHLG